MLRITADLLQKLDACEEQVAQFRESFPHGADLTLENLTAARAGRELLVAWLAPHILSEQAHEVFTGATAGLHVNIHRPTAPLWDALTAAKATGDAVAIDAARTAVVKASSAAWAEYYAAEDALLVQLAADPANLPDSITDPDFLGVDFWSRKLYRMPDGRVTVDVDGQLHSTTAEGEPLWPIGVPTPEE